MSKSKKRTNKSAIVSRETNNEVKLDIVTQQDKDNPAKVSAKAGLSDDEGEFAHVQGSIDLERAFGIALRIIARGFGRR